MFRKPIRKTGVHSYGIYIERKLVEQLALTPDTELEMVTDGDALIFTLADKAKKLLKGKAKKFHKHGNGLSLSLDTSLLEVLGIPLDAMLEQATDGESTIVLRYTDDPRRKLRFRALLDSVYRTEIHSQSAASQEKKIEILEK